MTAEAKHTYALVSEKGWVHVVFNDEGRANEQAAKRSVPLDQVNPDKGLHCYSVVRYIPAESAKAEAQPAGTALAYLFRCRAQLHRGSETGLYFFELFGKAATVESYSTVEEAALAAYATLSPERDR